MRELINSNLATLRDDELKYMQWGERHNLEEIGQQYIKRFGRPIPGAQALTIGYAIRDLVQQRLKGVG